MPHLIIEYAHDLASDEQVEGLLSVIHQAALSTELFPESHIKVRAMPVCFYLAGGAQDPFIHAQLRIKQGRSDEQKKHLSESVLAAIVGQGWAAKVITVEVVDMDPLSYAKWVG